MNCALFHDSALKTFYYASKNKNHPFIPSFEPTGFCIPNENALSTRVNFCYSLFLDLWNSYYYSFAYIEYYLICLIFKILSVIKVTMYLCFEEFYWGKIITGIKPRENYAFPEKECYSFRRWPPSDFNQVYFSNVNNDLNNSKDIPSPK